MTGSFSIEEDTVLDQKPQTGPSTIKAEMIRYEMHTKEL
jgi:hypothetical protein